MPRKRDRHRKTKTVASARTERVKPSMGREYPPVDMDVWFPDKSLFPNPPKTPTPEHMYVLYSEANDDVEGVNSAIINCVTAHVHARHPDCSDDHFIACGMTITSELEEAEKRVSGGHMRRLMLIASYIVNDALGPMTASFLERIQRDYQVYSNGIRRGVQPRTK